LEFWGHEFTLSGAILTGKVTWNASFNMSFDRNQIKTLLAPGFIRRNNTITSDYYRNQVGHTLGEFYGFVFDGLYKDDQDLANSAKYGTASAVGTIKMKDVEPDKVINESDRTFIGNPNPDFTAGLNLDASYKNFDFSAFFYASVGNDVINYVRYWTDFPQVFDGAVSKDAVYNSWTPEKLNAKVPRLERTANFSNTTEFNSYYLENGSFLRCKSMVLGYTVPSAKLTRFGVNRFRFYIQAANLFTITKYTGLDPELTTSDLRDNTNFGIDFGNYPSNQKTYLIGVNLSF
jgi:hypothetical protein